MPKRESFGKRLKRLRVAAGLTGRELARRTGISSPQISFLERDMSDPGARNLARLADELNITMDELYRGKNGKV